MSAVKYKNIKVEWKCFQKVGHRSTEHRTDRTLRLYTFVRGKVKTYTHAYGHRERGDWIDGFGFF